MPRRTPKENEHAFSVELKSKEYIKHVSMSNDAKDKVLIEGFLGELEEINTIEGVMLEIKGGNGILRMDLKEKELRKWLSKRKRRNHSKRRNKNENEWIQKRSV